MIFGAQLPPAEESKVGDEFYDLILDKRYVFDDGEWQEVPQTPEAQIPTPAQTDSGKVLSVNESGAYALAESRGGVIVELTDPYPVGERSYYYNASILAGEIAEKITSGIPVYALFDLRDLGSTAAYLLPIERIQYTDNAVESVLGQYITYDGKSIDSRFTITIYAEPVGSPEHSAQAGIITGE